MDNYTEIQQQIEADKKEAEQLMPASDLNNPENDFGDMTGEVSDCCGAVIIFSDICSDCKEHI